LILNGRRSTKVCFIFVHRCRQYAFPLRFKRSSHNIGPL
jgi:hypothetical protein